MTVYVDDMRRPARLTGRPARWSHLMADGPYAHEQLMQAALDLGLNPEWIQHEGTHREHFDVTETVRQEAIGRGIADPISYPRGTSEVLARKRARLTQWWFGCWRCGCSDIRHDPGEIPTRCPCHDVELIAKAERLDGPPVSGLGHECEAPTTTHAEDAEDAEATTTEETAHE